MRALEVHRRAKMVRARHHVRDDLGVGRVWHRRLEDADNRGRAGTETHRLANDGGIAVERAGPESIGQNDCARRTGAVIRGVQQAAEHGTQSHHLEVRPSDDAGAQDAWIAVAEHRELDRREIAEGADRRWRGL